MPVIVADGRLTAGEFERIKIAETIETREGKSWRLLHSPQWQLHMLPPPSDPHPISRWSQRALAWRAGTGLVHVLFLGVKQRVS
jgi:hypothetical protein